MSTQQVTICPPQPENPYLHFDRNSFDNRRSFAVAAKTGISFQDYGRMHQFGPKGGNRPRYRGERPVWAVNDKPMREVITRYLEHRYYLPVATEKTHEERLAAIRAEELRRIPAQTKRLGRLLDAYSGSKAEEQDIQQLDSEIVMMQRGFANIVAAVVYNYYRRGFSSSQISEDLGCCIKPPHIRILLYRLRLVWKEIEGSKVRRRKIRGIQERSSTPIGLKQRSQIWPPARLQQLWTLRASGYSFAAIGKVLGCSGECALSAFDRHFPSRVSVRREADTVKVHYEQRTPRSKVRQEWSAERLQRMRDLRASGKMWREIAEDLGCKMPTALAAYRRYFPNHTKSDGR